MPTLITLLLLLLFPSTIPLTLPTSPDRFFKSSSFTPTVSSHKSKQYFELARPLPSDRLTPSCTLRAIHHSFANTINKPPFTTLYSPPSDCPSFWSHVTLEFSAKCKGDQYDRISGLWLGGVELLRTSTAEPTKKGIFWTVRKDITRYSSLLVQENLNFTIMLENVVDDVYTGVYHVDVTLFFYNDTAVRVPFTGGNNLISMPSQPEDVVRGKSIYQSPADLIIPVSSDNGYDKGYWFKIETESDTHLRKVRFPNNTHKAVLELYVSFHGNDEFWYSNPSNSYIRMNNLSTLRGNGPYREVFVTIDGKLVGSEVPFPVVFAGGINPLFWEPVVAIGAFNLPSYDFDLTPFLGLVLDGKDHVFGVGVSDGISYWLMDANLHLWLDFGSSNVKAESVVYLSPASFIIREEEFKLLDGSMQIKGKSRRKMEGWVVSSAGNVTTSVSQELKIWSSITFERNGTLKSVQQKIKTKKQVKVLNDEGTVLNHVKIRRRHPLKVITATLPGSSKDTYRLVTNVSHAVKQRYTDGQFYSNIDNKQISIGWMEVKDHFVLHGEAITNQSLSCRDMFGCYVRTVAAINGRLVQNLTAHACPSVM